VDVGIDRDGRLSEATGQDEVGALGTYAGKLEELLTRPGDAALLGKRASDGPELTRFLAKETTAVEKSLQATSRDSEHGFRGGRHGKQPIADLRRLRVANALTDEAGDQHLERRASAFHGAAVYRGIGITAPPRLE
jgi:hypothetical protein